MKLDRRTYADHYGPTTGDRVRLADTDLIIRIERDHTVYGDEAKFGGGKVIRDGMGQSPVARRARRHAGPRHHLGRRRRQHGHLQGGRRHPRRPHRRDRQGRQPRRDGRRHAGPRDRRLDRNHRRRRAHPDGRRDRLARALHLAEPDSRRVPFRHHDAHRRRHRPGDRHQRDDLHAGRVEHPAHVRSGGRRFR